MSIRKRGSSWQVRVRHAGRRIEQTVRGSKSDAKAVEAAILQRLSSDRVALQKGSSLDRTYGEALMQYHCPASMLEPLRKTMQFQDVNLKDLPRAANQYRDELLHAGYSPCTVNRRLAVMQRVLKLAYKEWEWLREPIHDRITKASEKGTAREVYLTFEQVSELCSHMDDDEAQMIVRLAVGTGLRRSEIWRLQPDDYRDGVVIIRQSKSKKPRTVPVPEWVGLELPIRMSDWEFRKQWEPARKAAGLEHVHFHDLRHTYASWLMENPDVPVTMVRDLMGHSGLQMTSRYSHIRQNAEQAITALDKKWGHSGVKKKAGEPA